MGPKKSSQGISLPIVCPPSFLYNGAMPRDLINEAEVLPAIQDDPQGYALEPFVPVNEQATDQETTASDLAMLNNHLAVCSMSLPHMRTIDGLCKLSITVAKLIETRRKVKKLKYGDTGKQGPVWEVLE